MEGIYIVCFVYKQQGLKSPIYPLYMSCHCTLRFNPNTYYGHCWGRANGGYKLRVTFIYVKRLRAKKSKKSQVSGILTRFAFFTLACGFNSKNV